MKSSVIPQSATAWLAAVLIFTLIGPLRAQETDAEKILNRRETSSFFSCEPDKLKGAGCCGAPGRPLCSILPSCTAPSGNSRRSDPYSLLVLCELPQPSCSPVFAANQTLLAQKGPSLDVTFYVTSDIHYWREAFHLPDQVRHVRLMNEFNGLAKPWPAGIGIPFGFFTKPWGVLMAGDMTTLGQAEELGAYRTLYEEGRISDSIRYPVFHGLGNHDVDSQRMFDFVGDSMGCGVNLDPASHNYSWDWGKLHLIQLNEWAGYQTPSLLNVPCPSCPPIKPAGLAWLERDLANVVGDSERPVVIVQHLGCDPASLGGASGTPCLGIEAGTRWWSLADRQAFFDTIRPYNVIGLFTGHSHSAGVYRAYDLNDRGGNIVNRLDNYVNGSGGADGNGEFYVVRVTDSYLDVVPIRWDDLPNPTDAQRQDQSSETSRIGPATNLTSPFKFNQPGCRKRIGDRIINVPANLYRLASAGGNLVSVTNTGTAPIPGPLALRMRGTTQFVSFVDSCVDEDPNNKSYILFNLALGQSLAPGNSLFINAGVPYDSNGMSLVVLTPIQGYAPANGVTITVAPKTAFPPGSITFYGPPSTDFFAEAVGGGGVPWLITAPVSGRFDVFGRATVNYAVDAAKLPDQSTGSLTVAIRATTGLTDAQGSRYSRTVPFSLHFKAPVTVQLTATPAVFARPTDPHATFKAVLTHPRVTDPLLGTVPLPSGEVDLYDVTVPHTRILLSRTFLGNQVFQDQSNCDAYPEDTVVFGNDGIHNYCPSLSVATSNPWQFSLSPGLHTLVAFYEGSGNGDAYYQPADSAPLVYRAGEPVASIRVLSGNDQATFPGVAFDDPIVFQALDTANKPVVGAAVAVDFNPNAASAGFGASTEWAGFTDSNGIATSTRPIANGIVGTFNGVARLTEPGPTVLAPLLMTNQAPGGPAPVIAVSVASRFSPTTSPAGVRQWVLNVRNSGGPAHGLQMTRFLVAQESGTPCTPAVQTPFPLDLASLATAGSATTAPVLIDFGSCALAARFTVTVSVSANGGAYATQTVIAHQFQ